ncbi:ArsR/SmtB family transcription factor [Hutsoniella sourekii]|uniref:ArsR/SmtB family transcription factor n=1 Tax=Hutsoniella sourekii TaxID=87650 RepID=UPI0004B9AF49|nr:metalloregulator ArsR/SmtB family transcription factor [Hutsoniella sourekii]
MSKSIDVNSETILDDVSVVKILAHPIRYSIALVLDENGVMNVSSIQNLLQLPQSTVSQHISKMREAGVVTAKRDGTKIYYELTNPKAQKVIGALKK